MIEHETLLVTLVKRVSQIPSRRPRRRVDAVAREPTRIAGFCRQW